MDGDIHVSRCTTTKHDGHNKKLSPLNVSQKEVTKKSKRKSEISGHLNVHKSNIMCLNGNEVCSCCKSFVENDYLSVHGTPQLCLTEYGDNPQIERRYVLSHHNYIITACCRKASHSRKLGNKLLPDNDGQYNEEMDRYDKQCQDINSESKSFQSASNSHNCNNHVTLSLSSIFISSILIFITLLTSQIVVGFNVDTRTALVQTGQDGSMFGYAVSQHNDGGQQWLLIGAPEHQTKQPGVRKGGAVFRCKVDDVDCHPVPFDTLGNRRQWNGSRRVQIEQKSGQWLGASVYSAGTGGVIVACAPRYVYFTEDRNRREPVGTCHVGMGSTTKFIEYSPCKDELRMADVVKRYQSLPEEISPFGFKSKGYCQTGLSAALTSDGRNLIMGAVGSYYWQGQVYSQPLQSSGNDELKQTPQQNNSDLYDNSYKGYSMAVGQFTGSGEQDYVVGIPKENLKGRVAVYDSELNEVASVLGEQIGEYFGYSVGVGDFNGDGLDDIAVGAPFHTDYKSDEYETGRVHVFYQNSQNSFDETRTRIRGRPHSRSRFGSAVSGIKDINRDGYDDLAVGAPYGGTLNKGAVYIFHGSPDGINKEPSQIVHAADINPTLLAFGSSISGGLDQDKNNYPDLLVGSYESDSAVFLRARPIVRVTAVVTTIPSVINLEKQICHVGKKKAKRSVTCFEAKACIQYMGMRVSPRIQLDLSWTLDYGKNLTYRAYFMDSQNVTNYKTITLAKKKEKCILEKCYIKEDIRDKLNPVGIKLSFALVEKSDPEPDELLPILDQDIPTFVDTWTHIKKDCGPDDICIPELDVIAYSLTENHIHGTSSDIDLQVTVHNNGEDSYETQLHVQLPYGVSYVRVHNIHPVGEVKCTTKAIDMINKIICDIGNPLQSKHMVNFTLTAKAKEVNDTEYLRFFFHVNSTNKEVLVDRSNNFAVVDVPMTAMAEIQVSGVSDPEQVLYNRSYLPDVTTDVDVGPQVIHLYEIRNEGPSNVSSILVTIDWPTYFTGGYQLMYLPIMPEVVRGEGFCETDDVNTLNLTITQTQSKLDDNAYDILKKKLKTHRRKRSALKRSLWEDDYTVKRLECNEEQTCTVIRCEVNSLDTGESALIQITSRVWIETIIQLQEVYPALVVKSEAIAQVVEVPYKVKATTYSLDTFQIETFVAALNQRPRKAPLQFWVIAIAVFCGCLLLLLLILLLWKIGFFHRTSIDDMSTVPVHTGTVEKQPNPENGTSYSNGVYRYDAIPNDQL